MLNRHRHSSLLSVLVVLGALAHAQPALGWTPPLGIPAPAFGIEETVRDDAYTHWVDNSGSCSDFGDGTPTSPRCTIPRTLAAGSIVQVRGGPYSIRSETWTHYGTSGNPVYVRGPTNGPRPDLGDDADVDWGGSYAIVEWLAMRRFGTDAGDADHLSFRNNVVNDHPGIGCAFCVYSDATDIVIYHNEIAHNGTIPSSADRHGINMSAPGISNVWIVDNHIHHNSGDSVQFCHSCVREAGNTGPANVYIGRNEMHEDEENAIDIKEARGPVVISENTIWGYRPGEFSGSGDAIRLNDEGEQGEIWVLNNRIYDSTLCINPSRSSAASYILGNKLWDCLRVGIGNMGDVTTVVANNTVVNAPRGIDGGSEVRGNIVLGASDCHICTGVSGCSHNLVWQPGGTPEVEVSCASGVQDDPLMVMNGNEQTGLQADSPAIDAGFAHPAYAYFETTYGLDIRRDPAGTPRPLGAAWDIGAHEPVESWIRPPTGARVGSRPRRQTPP